MKIISRSMLGLMMLAATALQPTTAAAAPKTPVLRGKCVCFCGSTKVVLDGVDQIEQCRSQNDKGCYAPGDDQRKGLTKCNMTWANKVPGATVTKPPDIQLQKK